MEVDQPETTLDTDAKIHEESIPGVQALTKAEALEPDFEEISSVSEAGEETGRECHEISGAGTAGDSNQDSGSVEKSQKLMRAFPKQGRTVEPPTWADTVLPPEYDWDELGFLGCDDNASSASDDLLQKALHSKVEPIASTDPYL